VVLTDEVAEAMSGVLWALADYRLPNIDLRPGRLKVLNEHIDRLAALGIVLTLADERKEG
jgi:hypothetical protein